MLASAFVTGGTGFVGLNLIEQLTRLGWRVTALHRPSSDLRHITRFPVRLVEGDLLDPPSLARVVPQGADVVFHLAADTSMWSRHNTRQHRTHVEGTRNLVEATLVAGAGRFVHTSTWNVYGLEQGEISEALPQRGKDSWINYNRTKFLAEEEVRRGVDRGLDAVIINPSHIIGRYDRSGWARLIITAHQRWLPGVPPGSGTFCHGEAVAQAHIAAAENGRTGANYLLSGCDATFVEVFRLIAEVSGRQVGLRPLPGIVFRLAAWAAVARAALDGKEPEITPEGVAIVLARARVISRRAEDELRYRPAPLRTMIQDAHQWLVAEGIIPSRRSG